MHDALVELERVALFAQSRRGLLPPWSARPMLPHEVRACVDFTALDRVMTTGYAAVAAGLQVYRDTLQGSLRVAMNGVHAPREYVAAAGGWATDPARDTEFTDCLVAVTQALNDVVAAAGLQVLAEARAQGVTVAVTDPAVARRSLMADAHVPVLWLRSKATTTVLTVGLSPRSGTDMVGTIGNLDIKGGVDLGRQAVHVAHGEGRAATMAALSSQTVRLASADATPETGGVEPSEIYASELLDERTCDPCSAIDGTNFASMDEAELAYPDQAGYVDCAGGARCRGTLVVVWNETPPPPDTAPPEPVTPEPPPPPTRDERIVSAADRTPGTGGDLHAALRGLEQAEQTALLGRGLDFADETTGLTSTVRYSKASPDGRVIWRSEITDAAGAKVGQTQGMIAQDGVDTVVHNLLFDLDPSVQGSGFATRYYQYTDDWYASQGVQRLELNANIDVGGYAWARAGYDFADPQEAVRISWRILEAFDDKASDAYRLARRAHEDILFGTRHPTPYELSRVGYTDGATMWPGKAGMLGSDWTGVKVLK